MTQPTGDEALVERLRRDAIAFKQHIVASTCRQAADRLEALNAECERAWEAYRIAHDQAMANVDAALTAAQPVEGD